MDKLVLSFVPIYTAFIIALGLMMFQRRMRALRQGVVSVDLFKAYSGDEPEDLRIIRNHFSSQFEVPILFFVTCMAAVQINKADFLTLLLGAVFILTRLIHSYIHLGSNNLRARAPSYFLGLVTVMIMCVHILVV